jgi:ATP-dependent Lon protease
VDKNQRDYYLREQLKTIQNELGDGENTAQESAEYRRKFLSSSSRRRQRSAF